MDSIKDRNGMDLTEAEDIKKKWQVELYKGFRMGNTCIPVVESF